MTKINLFYKIFKNFFSRTNTDYKQLPRLAARVAIGVNIVIIVVMGAFLVWDYYATMRTHILEKKIALREEAQILLSSVLQFGGHHSLQELQEFIDTTCGSMQESTSPGHHIVVKMPSETIQAHSHGRASPEIFEAMKEATHTDNGIAETEGEGIVVGFAKSEDKNVSVYVSEYLSNIHLIGRKEVIRRSTSILFLGLTLMVVLNILLHRYIAKPLNTMVYAVWRFGRGQLQTRMPEQHTQELGILADEFNQMAGAIEKADQEHIRLSNILAAQNKELEQFVYITSHDLRSPVTNIQGFGSELSKSLEELEKILDTPQSSEEMKKLIRHSLSIDMRESIDYICTSAAKMDTLIDGLLRLSRVGHAPLNIEKLDMNALLQEIIDTMKFQIKDAGASVTIDPLPHCLGDAAKINQAFSNLMTNALKYLDPNRQGLIRIGGRVENKMSIYSVADNGIGIPPEHQSKVFEVFHRVDPNIAVPGEGLGLSIVKRIIDRHDGTIHVESQPGTGSTFYVGLPAA